MSNDTHDDETQPVRAEGTPDPDPAPEAARTPVPGPTSTAPAAEPAATGRRGFRQRLGALRRSEGRDRTFGLAALIASALAGIIVGGLGFAAVHAVTDDGPRDRGGWMQRGPMGGDRDGDERGPGRGGMRGGPPGMPGQLPPTTAPDDEDSGSSS